MITKKIPSEFQDDKGISTFLTERGKELFYNIINNKKYRDSYQKHSFRQLKSKKNTVAFIIFNYKPIIIKHYSPGFHKNMQTEYNILNEAIKKSNKINMPTLYDYDSKNNIILMNFINGNNLCDIINNENISINEKNKIMILLAGWFKNFHTYFKKSNNFTIRDDSILRNFIYNDKIIGLDFEEARSGKPEEDIAEMCSSILTTNPMFESYKFELCKTLIKSYVDLTDWIINDIWDEISYSLLKTSVNRRYNFSKNKANNIVEKIKIL